MHKILCSWIWKPISVVFTELKRTFDSHRVIFTINKSYKPKIDILTETKNCLSLLLRVGGIQRLVRPCPFYVEDEGHMGPLSTKFLVWTTCSFPWDLVAHTWRRMFMGNRFAMILNQISWSNVKVIAIQFWIFLSFLAKFWSDFLKTTAW